MIKNWISRKDAQCVDFYKVNILRDRKMTAKKGHAY